MPLIMKKTVDGQPVKIRLTDGTLYADNPIGAEIKYAGSDTPIGFLEEDGSTFSTTDYPELYAVLGTNTLPNNAGWMIKAKNVGVPADFVTAIQSLLPRYPDYARGSLYTTGATSYTCTEDCYISYFIFAGSANTYYLCVDGIEVSSASSGYVLGQDFAYVSFNGYVKKGAVITVNNNQTIPVGSLKVFGLV